MVDNYTTSPLQQTVVSATTPLSNYNTVWEPCHMDPFCVTDAEVEIFTI